MNYSTDSYAAMLLCLALSANREEYAHPLTTAEYRDICRRTKSSGARHIGALIGVDISGLMQLLGMNEEEAYRIYTLMSRSVQLSYTMEGFAAKGIRVITEFDEGYPERLSKRAGDDAPPVLYVYGGTDTLNAPAIGILGMSGIKTSAEVRASIEAIARFAKDAGYRIMAGGELGVSRVMEGYVLDGDSSLTSVLAGGLSDYITRSETAALYNDGRLSAVSLEHPEALFTVPHAITRNKMLMSLAEAVFIFNTDGKRGETDGLRHKRCDWIYAWNGYEGNHGLINKGAISFGTLNEKTLADMTQLWRSSRSEQLSLFDLLD